MEKLFRDLDMQALLRWLPIRSDITPKKQHQALCDLRDRMSEHIDQCAMLRLEEEIRSLKKWMAGSPH